MLGYVYLDGQLGVAVQRGEIVEQVTRGWILGTQCVLDYDEFALGKRSAPRAKSDNSFPSTRM